MPLLVPAYELQVGMKLSAPVMARNHVLLQSGKVLTETDIAVIRRRFPDLHLKVEDAVLDQVVEFEDDERERDVALTVQARIAASVREMRERFTIQSDLRVGDFAVIESTVNDVIEFLRYNPSSAAVVCQCLAHDGYIATHTGNVFYLSVLLATAMLDYVIAERRRQTNARDLSISRAADLAALGLGVMAMDLGMLQLQHIYHPDYRLTDEDRSAIFNHPRVGAEMLPESFSPVGRAIVRTHHENMDGTGYPDRLPGDRILVFSRVVRIADAFDAAISGDAHRAAKSPTRALWEMAVGPYRRFYDRKLMQVFMRMVQPFPIGAKVRLEDGMFAVVVRYNRGQPFRPVVMVAFDSTGQPLPKEQLRKPIDLAMRPDVRIAHWRGEDTLYVYDTDDSRVPVRPRFETALHAAYP